MEADNVDKWASAAATLPNLSVLSFYDCEQLTDAGVAHLSTLTTLTYLCLRSCYQVPPSISPASVPCFVLLQHKFICVILDCEGLGKV
jgi:hypothetical protein